MNINKLWKVTNTSDQLIKVSIATASNAAPGVILQPGEYCLSLAQFTTPLDAQFKRGFVDIDMDYDNKYGLPLAIAFNKNEFELAKEQTEKYTK